MHIHSPRRHVHTGRCLPYTGRPASAAAQSSRFDSASPDGCIAPMPDSLRPSVGGGDTFTMGDAHPFAEAMRSPWAMPPLNRTARLCRGPAIPNEFASPDGCIAPTRVHFPAVAYYTSGRRCLSMTTLILTVPPTAGDWSQCIPGSGHVPPRHESHAPNNSVATHAYLIHHAVC